MMNWLSSDVRAFLLKLNHDVAHEGAVPRLISDFQSVSFQLDYIRADDVVIKNRWGKPLLVIDPALAAYLEERPLTLRRKGSGYYMALTERRESERLLVA
ncbi:MAG: hypothetical protein VX834_06515 [Myxococcota bacterium]|nr:hypothetical protein [Myxococcota bacterium]